MPEKMLKGFHFLRQQIHQMRPIYFHTAKVRVTRAIRKHFFFQATGCIIPSPYKGWDNRNSPNTKSRETCLLLQLLKCDLCLTCNALQLEPKRGQLFLRYLNSHILCTNLKANKLKEL